MTICKTLCIIYTEALFEDLTCSCLLIIIQSSFNPGRDPTFVTAGSKPKQIEGGHAVGKVATEIFINIILKSVLHVRQTQSVTFLTVSAMQTLQAVLCVNLMIYDYIYVNHESRVIRVPSLLTAADSPVLDRCEFTTVFMTYHACQDRFIVFSFLSRLPRLINKNTCKCV